jgi:hypothetical protein
MVSSTVQLMAFPVVTAMLGQVIPAREIEGTISTTNVTPVELSVAVTFTSVVCWTPLVDIVNWAWVVPAVTVTVAGTLTGSGVLLGVAMFVNAALSETTAPPAGAGGETVTTPVMLVPPAAVNGTTTNEVMAVPVGSKVICTGIELELSEAVTITVRCAVSGEV